MLLIKSYVAPTNSDVVSSGNIVADYYVGRELHPRIFGWDVKQFTNCRFGMIYWAVGILCYAHKNIELNDGIIQLGMAVNVALQLIYISKFFYWEMGYMNSMDIQHDKAGFYICWGCLVWVPSVYTSHSFYLTENAPDISVLTALAIFTFGFLCIWINYDSDNQRYVFRQSNGECFIFGKQPRYLVAEYVTASGESRKNLLLLDGWWKISRHFHYMPEILASLCWGLPALNTSFVGPYFYTTFLTILLFDRAVRDDNRCAAKYGPHWTTYKKEVPYLIIPFVY
jgi:7-dehydrocholesterol reductase